MNGDSLLILIIVVVIIIIIIITTRKGSKRHVQKGYELEQQGRHLEPQGIKGNAAVIEK